MRFKMSSCMREVHCGLRVKSSLFEARASIMTASRTSGLVLVGRCSRVVAVVVHPYTHPSIPMWWPVPSYPRRPSYRFQGPWNMAPTWNLTSERFWGLGSAARNKRLRLAEVRPC